MKKIELKHEGKTWWCPKCGSTHIINSAYSYRPRRCEKCKYRIWINGEYIVEPLTGYKHLTIINHREYTPGVRGHSNERKRN